MNKKKGWGTFSIILFIIGIMFPLELGRTFCLGDVLLESIGLKGWITWDNGTFNIKVIISEVFFITGFILGKVFYNDKYAKIGRTLCLALGAVLGISLLYLFIFAFPAFHSFKQ